MRRYLHSGESVNISSILFIISISASLNSGASGTYADVIFSLSLEKGKKYKKQGKKAKNNCFF